MNTTSYQPGDYVRVPFGQTTQLAYVVGKTSTGRVKVRTYLSSLNRWSPNPKTVDAARCQVATASRLFPAPPDAPVRAASGSAGA